MPPKILISGETVLPNQSLYFRAQISARSLTNKKRTVDKKLSCAILPACEQHLPRLYTMRRNGVDSLFGDYAPDIPIASEHDSVVNQGRRFEIFIQQLYAAGNLLVPSDVRAERIIT